ncbi:MAG: hypothetical protein JO049_15855, partial [Hyphomicrobiales bacterium]|nr:hypothetical protein [Hyphomicrobiales bacterium]
MTPPPGLENGQAGFRQRSEAALADAGLRANIRGAMEFLRARRQSQFLDAEEFEAFRRLGESIRRDALARLPQLLERLEAQLTARGVKVH